MNYYIKLIGIIALTLISFSSFASNSEQLPNGGFENWQDENNAEGWNTLSIEFLFFSIYLAEQTTDAAAGDFAVKLTTESVAGFAEVPGLISLGSIDLENLVANGGIPFTERPTELSFSYKYFPVNDDMMGSFLLLTKWNETTQKRDTIGGTIFSSPLETEDYEHITLPVIYFSDLIPDTINVGFASSSFMPQQGSTLFIDSVHLGYEMTDIAPIALPATNIESSSFTANWIPVPLSEYSIFQLSKDEEFTELVENYENIIVENAFPDSGVLQIENILPGRYFYRLQSENEERANNYSNRITVSMPTQLTEPDNITQNGFEARWIPAHGAQRYFVDVATDQEFTEMVPDYQMHPADTVSFLWVEGLAPDTPYFYRVYVQYDDENLLSSQTDSITTTSAETSQYNLCLNANPVNAGTLEGEGEFEAGARVTINVVPANNFRFLYWENENTSETIEDQEHSFTMPEENICFTAWFENDSTTSVFQLGNKSPLKIYPVPAGEVISFEADEIMEKVVIYTITGKIMDAKSPYKTSLQIDLTSYDTGNYIFQIKTKGGTYNKTIPIKGKDRK
ncbi:MAG: InlB B-repeat-containing protein [Bacteroidota bacterium]